MVLDDVTFARVVLEGKVSTITVSIIGPKATVRAGQSVTRDSARAGLRVTRGPDWNKNNNSDGGVGRCGTLVRRSGNAGHSEGTGPDYYWHVRWDCSTAAESTEKYAVGSFLMFTPKDMHHGGGRDTYLYTFQHTRHRNVHVSSRRRPSSSPLVLPTPRRGRRPRPPRPRHDPQARRPPLPASLTMPLPPRALTLRRAAARRRKAARRPRRRPARHVS